MVLVCTGYGARSSEHNEKIAVSVEGPTLDRGDLTSRYQDLEAGDYSFKLSIRGYNHLEIVNRSCWSLVSCTRRFLDSILPQLDLCLV